MSADWPPLVVTVAPNGAHKTRADHPRLPITPAELAHTAAACCEAGAAMIHLHVRDREERHTLDVQAYRAATAAIREAVGRRLIVQATTEAVGRYTPGEQMAMLRALRPEAASVALREICPDAAAERAAAQCFEWARREGVMVQHILYSADELRRFEDLRRRGVIPDEAPGVLYVLGRHTAGQRSAPADLLPFLQAGEAQSLWACCAFGPLEAACVVAAASLGGHVRVGFENNMQLADRRRAPDNRALVEQIVSLAAGFGRKAADADTARELMGAR